MSFTSEYMKLRKKRIEGEVAKKTGHSFTDEYNKLSADRQAQEFEEDIAPLDPVKRKEEKDNNRTWFQAGAFGDGYQFGDVSKAIIGTVGDVAAGTTKAILSPLEGVADFIIHGAGYIADAVDGEGQGDVSKWLHNEAEVDALGKVFDPAEDFFEKGSVLGEKIDKAEDVIGNFGGQLGLAYLTGGASLLALGASAAGSGMNEAYSNGATDEEAAIYGLTVGLLEAGTETLSGGLGKFVKGLGLSRGIGGLDDIIAKKITQKIANITAKNAAQWGIKAVGEGLEEVIAGFGTAVAKKMTYMSDEELSDLVKDENLLDSFLIGTVLSAGSQSGVVPGTRKGSLIEANQTGRDFVTGLTTNEEAVVNKAFEDRIAEAEKDGTKLTKREKTKMYDAVLEDLDKGRISVDTIEEVLGGDSYNAYKNTVDSEDAILKEYDELGKKQNATLAEQARYAELSQQVKDIKENSSRNDLKTKLSEEVFGLAKDSRLAESYNERVRRSRAFTDDVSKYKNENAKQTVQNAIDSGLMHDGGDAHDFVNLAAKVSEDQGYVVEFVTSKKLAEMKASGEVDIKADTNRINAFVSKKNKKMYVNMDTGKSLPSLVGHEITHTLESSGYYNDLKKAIFKYANTKGELISRHTGLERLYSAEDVDFELTSDLVGDYLFTDADFVNHLSTTNRNLFQRIYDEIKYLFKIATAGSKEARELEKVKRLFDKAYREGGKAQNVKTEGDIKHSLSDSEISSDSDGKQLTKEQSEYFKDSKMRDDNGNLKVMYHGSQDAGFHVFDAKYSDDDTSFFFVDRNDVAATYSGTSETYEAQTIRTAEDMNNFLAKIGYDNYKAVEKNGKFELLENNEHVAYSDTAQGLYDEFCWYEGVGEGDANYKVYLNLTNPLIVDAKGRNWNNISREFSQEVADRYNSLTADEKAALTDLAEWEDFQMFRDEILSVLEQKSIAPVSEEQMQLSNAIDKLGGNNINISNLFSIASDNFSAESIQEFAVKQMNTRDYAKKAKAGGYDGVIFKNVHDNGGYSNGSEGASTVAIAFSSEQIKSVANETPTGNKDIRYSLNDPNADENYLNTVRRGDTETAQKMLDEAADKAGYKKLFHHGTTHGDFTVFKTQGKPIWITEDESYAKLYSEDTFSDKKNSRVMPLYAKMDSVLDLTHIDTSEFLFEHFNYNLPTENINNLADAVGVDASALIKICKNGFLDRGWQLINSKKFADLVRDKGYDTIKENEFGNITYGVLDPTQIKSADLVTYDKKKNAIPLSERFNTENDDIRFSLSEPVEETGELMALHNLKSNELLKSLDLGGLPMPSIAIIKAEARHEQYGDVSLILPKESIDPQASRDNKVYGGDAWTPTYPKIEYKPKEKVSQKIRDKYYGLSKQIGYEDTRPLYGYVYELEDKLNRSGGEAALLEELYEDTDMMNLYLQDSGKEKVQNITKEIVTKISPEQAEMNQFFIDALGEDVILTGTDVPKGENPLMFYKNFVAEHDSEIRAAYKRFFMDLYGFTETEADNALSNTSARELITIMRDARRYIQNKGVTVRSETDIQATKEAIRKAASNGYRDWIDGLFKGIEEKSGIRNNAEYFTPSGNRRSWNALHWENTLENVVRVMRQQNQTGADAIFGAHQLFAVAAKDYRSIAEIKADTSRLYKMSEEEYEAVKDSYTQRMNDIASRIMDKTERNQFIAIDNAMECIVDAVRTSKTKAGISRELKQYRHLNVTEKDVNDIVALVTDISNMPTGYFEAKPMRAVSFDEIGVFVIPNNADIKLKQELLNRGYSIAEYDPNVDGDRQRVVNQFEEYKFSLADASETQKEYGNFNIYAKDILLDKTPEQDVAPVGEAVTENVESVNTEQPDVDDAPMDLPSDRYADEIYEEMQPLYDQIMQAIEANDPDTVNKLMPQYLELEAQYKQAKAAEDALNQERIETLDDAEAPPEIDAPYYGESEEIAPDDPFAERDIKAVGNRKVKAYMYENPEVKPFFQEEANIMLGELYDTTKGERFYTAIERPDLYGAESYGTWTGVSRHTTQDIAYLLDELGYTYAEIEKGLKAIIEDNGKENNACSKRIEFLLNSRLMNGHTDISGYDIPANQDYIRLLNEKQITEYNDAAFNSFMESEGGYAPVTEDITPVPDKAYEAIRPRTEKEPKLIRVKEGVTDAPNYETRKAKEVKGQTTMFAEDKTAKVVDVEIKNAEEKGGTMSWLMRNLIDKHHLFETMSIKTGNKELQSKANFMLSSDARAQHKIGKGVKGKNGAKDVRALTDIFDDVDSKGLGNEFDDYLLQMHNIDRMTLDVRFGVPNKAVFGDDVNADASRIAVKQYETKYPFFKKLAQDCYDFNNHNLELLVKHGVVARETADLWAKMYPHYVPITRTDAVGGLNIDVPLDTRKTSVNAPIKKATGGNSDIQVIRKTMAARTLQTFRAVAKNSFGVELKNTLGTTIESEKTDIGEIIDNFDNNEELLQRGKNGKKPTFTVFENGKKITFEITDDIYKALSPVSEELSRTFKGLHGFSEFRKKLITEYNLVFTLTNAIKDAQDVLTNSQHPVRTYKEFPTAFKELVGDLRGKGGVWITEYLENGGEQMEFFDSKSNTFKKDDAGIKKIVGIPLGAISTANNFVERIPRLAEYIASRKAGATIESAMLDAARVTTNFAAGGDITKFFNRNGSTFLNASVQGAAQQVRNLREAKANGLKGWAQLATKFAVAGIPALLLNHLLWDDDEEYEELSDYVKQNYYIVAKYGDGQFVRIPKGRTLAVIQDAFEQIGNAVTGNDEVDLKNFLELVVNNLAPNNPIDSNVFAPIIQAATNKTWYGEDLVPTRLQDLPAAEQYDESTDALSKWLGETFNISPIKLNYILDQYSGGVGDVFLPMMTPEAERGDDSFLGNMIAPLKDKFTTDSTMNNQNVSDFYTTKDELAKNAKSMYATDEDILKYKYFNSKNSELSDLYAEKREVQNSDLSNSEKYAAVREIQERIVALTKESLEAYNNVQINDGYAVVGDIHYRLSDGEWKKLTDKQYQQQEDVTDELGIDPSTYWQNKSEYDFAYEYPEKYAVAKSVGGFESYKQYSSEMYDIKADKDESGKSIVGSRKEKIANYINNLDIDYGERLILFKNEYKADDTYNYEIVDYLNNREDISYEDMEAILKELGFTVSSDGTVSWD